MQKKTIFITYVYSLAVTLLWAQNIFAQVIPATPKGVDLPTYLKWVFDAGMAIGFISVVIGIIISGIYFVLSSVSVEMRNKSRDWLSGSISGLLIFLLLYLILTTVNPKLAFFKIGPALDIPAGSEDKNEKEGVYFYEKADCQGDGIFSTSSPNFDVAQKIKSIRVINKAKSFLSGGKLHFALAYEKQNYQGKCQFFTEGCKNIDLTDIYSVYTAKYDGLSFNDKVTLYRNPSLKEDGGYLEVNTLFFDKDLKDLYFGPSKDSDSCTVPKDEQDCKEYDDKGKCIKRECPNLEGKNIASIKIDGKALVILSYWGPEDGASLQTFCQTYPNIGDEKKAGPKQTQWDNINNLYQYPLLYYPNHIRVMSISE